MANLTKPQDENNFNKTWPSIIAYCRPYLVQIIVALFTAVAGTIFMIIGPDYLSEMTDVITAGLANEINLSKIQDIGLLLTLLYGISVIFNYLQGYILTGVSQSLTRSLRSRITTKINNIPLKYYDSTSTGDVLSRVTNDADMVGQALNQSMGTLVTSITMLLGALIMMFYTNTIMATTAVLSSIIGFALMALVMKVSQKHFNQQQQELGAINGFIEETYTGHMVVKAYNGGKEAKQRFTEINERLYESVWKSQFISGLMMPLMMFIGNFGYVAICVVGGLLALQGSISFGVIVAFMVYVRLFTQPLSQIAQAATSLQSATAAGGRVFEFLELEDMIDEDNKTAQIMNARGEVVFDRVKFGYNPDKPVIGCFSAKAEPGQKIAIVGPTGAGKSTLVNLLMRFYELDDGEIRIDGIPIHSMKREQVHQLFGMVLQDTWLFEGSIRDNIVYCKTDVTDEEIIQACKSVGIDHFIRTLPDGYSTVLNDQVNLSAGQKQLITIARAMIQDAPLLILDEATSSVDTRTELLIQKSMDKLMKGRTSFVIAHRLSTIRNADLILVMKDGDIIESGTHDELLAAEGFYADLYQSQFEHKDAAV